MTPDEIETEWWAHYYQEHDASDEFDSVDFDEDAFLNDALDLNDWQDVINEQQPLDEYLNDHSD